MGKYKNQNVLVYGYGRTGKGLSKFLAQNGANVFVFDDKDKIDDININCLDFAVVSPGVPLDKPMCKLLREKKKKIFSEIEIGFENVEGKFIAITGTNGKTTTTTLVHEIFKAHTNNCAVAGNIGTPLISFFEKTNKNCLIALEVSSFQLESCDKFCPLVSTILNFAPDHLDRHKTMEEYQRCKEKIFANQTKKHFSVFNHDDETCLQMSTSSSADKFFFSMKDFVRGVFLDNGKIYFSKNGKTKEFVMEKKDILLLGDKNVENVLASICICKILKIDNETIKKTVSSFKPLKHRLEVVFKDENATYINDSKATNIASTLADLKAFETPVVLILGGSDKGENFDDLFFNLNKNVSQIIVFGETKKKIKNSAKKAGIKVFEKDTLKNSVEKAKYVSKKGDIILFAPACASFDMFENYVQRGEEFKKIVEELTGEN